MLYKKSIQQQKEVYCSEPKQDGFYKYTKNSIWMKMFTIYVTTVIKKKKEAIRQSVNVC